MNESVFNVLSFCSRKHKFTVLQRSSTATAICDKVHPDDFGHVSYHGGETTHPILQILLEQPLVRVVRNPLFNYNAIVN